MPQFTGATINRYMKRWLIGIGVFEVLLAAGFVVGAVLNEDARFGFFLTAGILGTVGIALLAWGIRSGVKEAEAERIEAQGIPGRATVTGLTQTGMYLNENPQVRMQLQVGVDGRAPYQVEHTEFVPLILLSQVSPGATLPVKVDPKDPSKVVIEWQGRPETTGLPVPQGAWPTTGTPGAGRETLSQISQALQGSGLQAATPFQFAGQAGYSIEQLRAYVRQNGISGYATIDQIHDSGQMVGDDRLFTLQTTNYVEGRSPRQGPPSAAMVPQSAAAKLVPGMRVPIKVAPDNPDLVLMEWDKV